MEDINTIASRHLGRSADGHVNKVYDTPNDIDASLLVPIPRELNRKKYHITGKEFYGYDIWNAYEISVLSLDGVPYNFIAKIIISNDTPNIIESKSLKLYFNSYNMAKLEDPLEENIMFFLEEKIKKDLVHVLGHRNVEVFIFSKEKLETNNYLNNEYKKISPFAIKIQNYNENPELLVNEQYQLHFKTQNNSNVFSPEFTNDYRKTRLTTNVLRSNCRVTNQPDYGDVFVYMKSKIPLPESNLFKYIVSLRNENHFHEEICELIYIRLLEHYKPAELLVACLYTRRGGIDINPIRASSEKLIFQEASILMSDEINVKLMRQ